jgi:heat shock transcription factor
VSCCSLYLTISFTHVDRYAFHKVPHMNASVLANDVPQELWEFVNPLFKRGHPELLGRIVRKQRPANAPPPAIPTPTGTRSRPGPQPALSSGSGQFLITDGTTTGEAGGVLVGPTGQQIVDLSALTSHIADMKRTQGTIAADLKALKASQEHLWREQLEQRDTQKKHQETIDLIVSFLERLFGTEGEGLRTLKEAMRRSGMARGREDSVGEEGGTKKRRRLGLDRMIGDGRQEGDDAQLVEITSGKFSAGETKPSAQLSDPSNTTSESLNFSLPVIGRNLSKPGTPLPTSASEWSSTSQRFMTLPSESEPSPSGPTPRRGMDQLSTDPMLASTAALSPLSESDMQPSNNKALAPYNYTNPSAQQTPLSPTSAANAAAAFNLDPSILSTTIGSLLQSPAAAQMFLNSLNNSIQGQALQSPRLSNAGQVPQFPLHPQSNGADIDPTLALFSPLPNQDTLLAQNDALLKSYQDAASMGADVEKLQESIDSLVRSMGLDVPNGAGVEGLNGLDALNDFNVLGNAAAGTGAGDLGGLADVPEVNAGQARTGTVGTSGTGTGLATQTDNPTPLVSDGLPDGFDVDEFLESLQQGVEDALEGL